ncbi:MAG: carbon-nitrogen hydrolase family protein, partial [Chloroflexi bacterium]|nr:carbon-nitrogen hydrolase family protein [Chloroflexota bacterium]
MSETTKLRVAAVQMAVSEQIGQNLEGILRAMAHCAEDRVQLAVFPETALTGYSPSIGHGRQAKEWPEIQAALQRIAEEAAQLGLWVAVGTETWEGEHWLNRLIVYEPDGQEAA